MSGRAHPCLFLFLTAIAIATTSGCQPDAGACKSTIDCFRGEVCVQQRCEPGSDAAADAGLDATADEDTGSAEDTDVPEVTSPGPDATEDVTLTPDADGSGPGDFDCEFEQVFAGAYNTCALTADGEAYCWGINDYGQLGDGTYDDQDTAQPVQTTLRFTTLAMSRSVTCGIAVEGQTYCWGRADGLGRHHHDEASRRPVEVDLDRRFVQLAAGHDHVCGLTAEGEMYCWGSNEFGQLGQDPSEVSALLPVLVSETLRFEAMAGGQRHTCALLKDDGTAYCWGSDRRGLLGRDNLSRENVTRHEPRPVQGSQRFTSISSTFGHTCGRTAGGDIYCWGQNDDQQAGPDIDGDVGVPMKVDLSASVSATTGVLAAGRHTCFVGTHWLNEVTAPFCWGVVNQGLVDPTTTPVAILDEANPPVMAAGVNHTCLLLENKKVACWGISGKGQLGHGDTSQIQTYDNLAPVVCAPR